MTIQESIHEIFSGKAFIRPLFYNYSGGLRFELSEQGDWLDLFEQAYRKSNKICSEIFQNEFILCVRIYGGKSLISVLSVLKDLKELGLFPEVDKEHWSELSDEAVDWTDGDEENYWHNIAFKLPYSAIKKVLWCSLASDLGVKPCPQANFYLFDIERGVVVWPYDDRGMDVVGNNEPLLKSLYDKFNSYLLDYDRETMDATFSKVP